MVERVREGAVVWRVWSLGANAAHALPLRFADPVIFAYDSEGAYVLGPCSHDRTVSLAVSPYDSALLAVAGWLSVEDNAQDVRRRRRAVPAPARPQPRRTLTLLYSRAASAHYSGPLGLASAPRDFTLIAC